jgi:hypothetical protein
MAPILVLTELPILDPFSQVIGRHFGSRRHFARRD